VGLVGGIFAFHLRHFGFPLPAIHVLVRLDLITPVQHNAIVPVFGGSSFPALAGHVGDAVIALIFIEVKICIAELVFDGSTGGHRGRIGFGVQRAGDGVADQGGIAVGVHAVLGVLDRIALLCQEIVDRIVGIFC